MEFLVINGGFQNLQKGNVNGSVKHKTYYGDPNPDSSFSCSTFHL